MAFPTVPELVGKLSSAYPRQKIDRTHYEEELADVPLDVLAPAMRAIIRTPGEWVPTVGDIRAACAAAVLELPTEREAVAQVDARIRWARAGRDGEPPELHPLVREAVDRVGGWHSLRVAEKPEVVRAQMIRYYRESRDGAIRDRAAADLGHERRPGLS